jgi:uncharacterized protein YjbI with pentapeptide repeats
MTEQPFPRGVRVENVDMSGVRLHGVDLEGAKLTDTFLVNADISGDIEGLVLNGVEVEPLVRAELERREPEQVMLRPTDLKALREAWSMLKGHWAEATARAAALPDQRQHERIDGEWSFIETLRHLVFATDCWLARAILLDPHPYHPWGLPWSGVEAEWGASLGLDLAAAPSLDEILPVRAARQQAVRSALDQLTDADLTETRLAPDAPGHPSGAHSVLQALHVLFNEEYEHHRYTVRDLAELESS